MAKGDISIWFFCGILPLAVWGGAAGAGVVRGLGIRPTTVLHELHPTLWWGALMTLAWA